MSIIENLFFMDSRASTTIFDDDSSAARADQTVQQNEQILFDLLHGRERQLFSDYVDAQSTIEGSVSAEKFCYGFRMGALLMLELLDNYEEFAEAQIFRKTP
ncbi:DUF6809 family protein [Clostridium sp. D33t1_170424_F3]|uniref:DUF6809 family protein n=1 Tax=Clostridium sp. D33t1_170424_F3 TaxID=2787099 RepID=UPI0018AA1F64|nr:DUF6809 family protein [Clostridium sp. D33t1_170424_F3]